MIVHGMNGLGDNIYQRAVIQQLAGQEPIALATPWPELYDDIAGVSFLRSHTALRTQAKNIRRQSPGRWSAVGYGGRHVTISYGHGTLERRSVPDAIAECMGVSFPGVWDLPDFRAYAPLTSEKPIAVVRPVTVRREWRNEARNPLPEYVADIARELMVDYQVISVADLAPGQEWLDGTPPPAHLTRHGGEFSISQLLGLIQRAALVVGGVGWIVPACIAAGTPLFCVLGGQGGHNAPERLTSSTMDLSRVGWAIPDNFCRCTNMLHRCDKTNSNLMGQFHEWRSEHSL